LSVTNIPPFAKGGIFQGGFKGNPTGFAFSKGKFEGRNLFWDRLLSGPAESIEE
jgi:hypothetical protein